MITKNDAAGIVAQELSRVDPTVVMFDEPIASGDYGWVFAYQSAKYLASGDISDMLVGNAPVLVDMTTGRLHVLGTARDIEFYINNYLAFGNPHDTAGARVELLGCSEGAEITPAVRAIKRYSTLGAKASMEAVKTCLADGTHIVECHSLADAEYLLRDLRTFGFVARQLPQIP